MTKKVKCVVWDLDNTLWKGTLLEDDSVTLDESAFEVVRTLDARGILNSIASRNDEAVAIAKLKEFGIDEYFLFPQINWNTKADSIERIADELNIGIDTLAFVDDQPFDREEVAFSHPEVRTFDAAEIPDLLDKEELTPDFITDESSSRRAMYVAANIRDEQERGFSGPKEEFLSGLNMKLEIYPAKEDDLRRAEELTVRTNQLNTTGITYSYEDLRGFSESDSHLLLVASLTDRFGSYGKIGLALVEKGESAWNLRLLLMSCRVMSRGVGAVMLNHVMRLARAAGVRLQADFNPNDRNRMMLVTLRFAGFDEVGRTGETLLLESSLDRVPPVPDYLSVVTDS